MPRQLQVWGTSLYMRCVGHQCRVIVAARSRAAAARALFCPNSYLAMYGSITGNAVELAVALSKPGTVFYAVNSNANIGGEYKEVTL